jgi:hypothetical protein
MGVTNAADFSNVLTKGQIEDMAGADELEVVKEVQVIHLPTTYTLSSRS